MMTRFSAIVACAVVCSPLPLAADDFGPSLPHAFRAEVEEALNKLRRMLDQERNPQYPADVPHTYEDKYLLSELAAKAASAGLVQSLSALLDNTWPGFEGKPKPEWAKGAPLLVFSSCEFCELKQTVDKEIQVAAARIEETEGILGSWKSTVKTKTQVKEHLWNWTVTWRLYVTAEGADESLTLLSGSQGKTLKTMTTPPAEPQQPRPAALCAPTQELDVSWLVQRLRTGAVDFTVNRSAPDCHTPARNRDIQAALYFFQKAHAFGETAESILLAQLRTLLSEHPDDLLKRGDMFQPVLALFGLDASDKMEASRPVLSADMEVVLAAHRRSLLQHLESRYQHWNRIAESKDESLDRSLVSLLTVVQEMANLARQMTSSIRVLESMLRNQLTAALGKHLNAMDFSDYIEFHGRELLRPSYQPNAFVFAVRRAQHHPEGTLSIEAPGRHSHQAISTLRVHHEAAPPMRVQLSSAATISLTGEHFVHAAVFHRFTGQSPMDLRLAARARQLSCFVLLVGKIIASDTFKPSAALIIQNKDDLVIPLLLQTVPAPKEFLDSIQSLSPEQQRFAKAFRKMQLSSSLFAVAIVQIKPALEKVLNLPEHSLTKEIQLTQDLIELFVRYQVAPDLMSYEPWTSGIAEKAARVGTAEKVASVKAHVKSLWETIAASKQKQLQEKEEQVKMRNMEACGSEDCSARIDEDEDGHEELRGPPSRKAQKVPEGARMLSRSVNLKQAKVEHLTLAYSMASPQKDFAPAADVPLQAPSPPPAPERKPSPDRSSQEAPSAAEAESTGALDYTALPHQLDANYLKFDTDAVLRPTTIDVGTVWTKQEQPGLLGEPKSRQLDPSDQREETNKAFDLLDALSRSGAEALQSSLHVVVAATHCFDETVLNTLVKQNQNPIEKMERSMLILASTLHQVPPAQLINAGEVDRVRSLSPSIFDGFQSKKKSNLM